MRNTRSGGRQRRRRRGNSIVRLNITSMIDMFTLMLVFLLKNYSAQGQLVTPAEGLLLPSSTVEKSATEALSVKISRNSILVENEVVIDADGLQRLQTQKEFLIQPLYEVLSKHSAEARRSAERFNMEFSGRISIQGDVEIPYNVLTRIMYTCGQAGYPVMNLIVYRRI